MKLRLGTRGSKLALAQAGLVREQLEAADRGVEVKLVPIETSGDGGRDVVAEDKSRFVKEIEQALLAEDVDLAVHSAKDVPAELPPGLAIVGVPARGDPRDVICEAAGAKGGDGDPLAALPDGARIGSASLRRRSQLLAARPGVEPVELRGNVDTRLRKLDGGDCDALVLAAAGLARLGIDRGRPLATGAFVPAPGQGCLALEARTGEEAIAELARAVTDDDALVCLTAERALVAGLDASCHTPVGAHARLDGERLELSAFAGLPDGNQWLRDDVTGDAADPLALGEEGATRMRSAGAAELLRAAEAQS